MVDFSFKINGVEVRANGEAVESAADIARTLLNPPPIEEPELKYNINDQVRLMFVTEGKIQAIKLYRYHKDCSLLTAKKDVEDLCTDLEDKQVWRLENRINNLETILQTKNSEIEVLKEDLANSKNQVHNLIHQVEKLEAEADDF